MPSLPGITTSERIKSKVLGFGEIESACGVVADRGFVAGQTKRARQGGECVRVVVDDQDVRFGGHGQGALNLRRYRALGRNRRSLDQVNRRAVWKFDAESCAASRLAFHGDCAAMIADHRLHDGQTQASSVLLGGVVRREKAFAFLARQSRCPNPKYRAAPFHRRVRCATSRCRRRASRPWHSAPDSPPRDEAGWHRRGSRASSRRNTFPA